jgi:PAS domain S-box-containing protein
MSDEILRELALALDMVVMECEQDRWYRVAGERPRWFSAFVGDREQRIPSERLAGKSSFLEQFLQVAEEFWDQHRDGEIDSGPWSETRDKARTGMLQATAIRHGTKRILVIRKLGRELREHRALVQRARENRLAFERLERAEHALRRSEARNRVLIDQLQESHDSLVAILDQLRVGTMLVDEAGKVRSFNRACQRMIGLGQDRALDRLWFELWPLPEAIVARLRRMQAQPAHQRSRVSTGLELPDKRRYWMEIDIQDDPLNSQRRIFVFYDLSEVRDIRNLVAAKERRLGLLGASDPMLRVLREIELLGPVGTTVLIEGETGTGKELVAREIHALSPRKDKPFVAVNCAGLTESLLASELFGHRRGAFTGAIEDKRGLFEVAHEGTLFLDEIGDMPLAVQASLLRVLQEREITRLGETKPRDIDVRVVAATHRDLQREVAEGRFRADLLYRIRVARIELPPLRERGEDLSLLVSAFVREIGRNVDKPVTALSPTALARLRAYRWPGNVRELLSAVEFAVIRCRGATIQCEDLPPEVLAAGDPPPTEPVTPMDEKERLLTALRQAGGNRTAAALLLGMSRATFYRRLADFDIARKGPGL